MGVSVDVWGCDHTLTSLPNKNQALKALRAALCVRSRCPAMEEAGGLGAVGILGAWLHLVPAGWRLCCTFEVHGGTRPRYPMTDWEGAGAAEAPQGGSGLLSRCEAASRSLGSSKWL